MIRKTLLPILALAGLLVGIVAARRSAVSQPPAPPVSEAPKPPFRRFVAGSGLVEASSENIAIGTQIPGVVSRVQVSVGSDVNAGDPLFAIDDRAQRALVASRQAAVQVAEAEFADARYEAQLSETLAAQSIASAEARDRDRFALQKAEAQLNQARADLKAAETDLERLTVLAPLGGRILQLKVHVGEHAPAGVLSQPLILMGSVSPLHVRIDVDENDAWRVRPGANAVGFLRGNKDIHTALEFVRYEPFVVPKKSLTGESTERVDTRVFQVLYRFDPDGLPIFVGQQMDVYIDASSVVTNAVPELPRGMAGDGPAQPAR